ncbi:MAG: hypothetical protein ACR2GR_06895 [Rhodothermales bacterium]
MLPRAHVPPLLRPVERQDVDGYVPAALLQDAGERAAIRRLFDWLVKDQVLPFNP